MQPRFNLVLISVFLFFTSIAQERSYLQVPGRDKYTQINVNGVSILPSGRYVQPAGQITRITHDPFGLTISPNGKIAVTLHNGVITILHLDNGKTVRVPDYEEKIPSPFTNGSLLGAAFYKDSRVVFLSGGDNGTVIAYDCIDLKVLNTYSLDGQFGDMVYQH
ncbi:MAG: phosphoesterase, partial [bacterium]